jgi:glycosyltransferase involved in cell wall biosynthesis
LDERLSIIIPAYNEAEHIYANVLQVCTTLQALDYEVIVADDGSTDGTSSEVERLQRADYPVRVVRQETNLGKGAALFYGFGFSSGAWIAFLDADLEIEPSYVPQLVTAMAAEQAEVAIGTKTLDANSRFPWPRRLLSLLYRQLVTLLFGLPFSDTQTGIKVFRREVLEAVAPHLRVHRFAFDVELLIGVMRLGYRIAEYPVTITYRRESRGGRIGIWQMARMLADTLSIYYHASFWRWLEPGTATRLWMIAFAAGLLLFGVGWAKVLTPLVLNPPVKQVFYIVALQFLPPDIRNWLIIVVGGALTLLALIQLNKHLMNAFARRDREGLSGLWQKR